MNRKELIEAMNVIRQHCKTKKADECDGCEIEDECFVCFKTGDCLPEEWDLKGVKLND